MRVNKYNKNIIDDKIIKNTLSYIGNLKNNIK
jgi:hypothetical protein